jgi:hypothetical protein
VPNRMNPFMWLYRDRSSPSTLAPSSSRSDAKHAVPSRVVEVFRKEGFSVSTDYLAGFAFRYVASQRKRKLLFIYNFIDNVIFNLPVIKPFRPFLLTSGEKL